MLAILHCSKHRIGCGTIDCLVQRQGGVRRTYCDVQGAQVLLRLETLQHLTSQLECGFKKQHILHVHLNNKMRSGPWQRMLHAVPLHNHRLLVSVTECTPNHGYKAEVTDTLIFVRSNFIQIECSLSSVGGMAG
jgi:hypothetical protein